MELKTGYKQTEFGAIPNEWHLKQFAEVMDGFSSGQTPYRAIAEYYRGDIPWITSGELNYNVITDTIEKITKEGVRAANLKIIPKGTFLFAITGLEAEGTRGSCAITGIEATTNQSCMALYPKRGMLITEYLFHYYVRYGKELAVQYCQGTKQQSYTGALAKKLPIILPPTLAEQTAIAAALSDTDQYITHLEKLIAKKRNIKQGAMQELLKPKEGWAVKKLGEVGKFSKGQGIKKDDAQSGEIPCVRYGELYTRHNDYVKGFHSFISREISLTAKRLKIGDILFAGSGETKEEIGKCAAFINDFEAFAGGDIVILSPVNQSSLFLGFLLNTPSVQKQKASRGQGDAVVHISSSQLEKIEVALPSLETQNQIASILSDMDSEITTLETKLSKAKSIKQGMMQQLLTGIIRLV